MRATGVGSGPVGTSNVADAGTGTPPPPLDEHPPQSAACSPGPGAAASGWWLEQLGQLHSPQHEQAAAGAGAFAPVASSVRAGTASRVASSSIRVTSTRRIARE